MGEFQVHRVRFFDYKPSAINCLSYSDEAKKVALSRTNATIEIWNVKDVSKDWHQEQIIPPPEGNSVESLVWIGHRLFSSGLHGNVLEHDLGSISVKHIVPTNSGAVWVMQSNESKTIIATGTEEGCVVLLKVTPYGLDYYKTLDKQEGRILSLVWCEAENVIVTGGVDSIRIWSINSGHAIQRLSPGRVERNKPTIVWTVSIASDFTIVSGDSRGKVCFWNGRQGTQISSIQSHRSDVLSLCVSPNGNTVVAAGVDPTIVQFEYTPVSVKSQWKRWVRTSIWNQHTHDVRSVIFIGNTHVVSAGIDCQITISRVQFQSQDKTKLFKRLAPLPHSSLVDVAKNKSLVMLRYPEHLQIWRLGHTHVMHTEKHGEILPLSRKPTKLIELKSKQDEYILSAAISADGQWIAYSDRFKPKLYQLNFDEEKPSEISLRKVRYITVEEEPVRCMCFTPDSNRLIMVTSKLSIQIVQLDPEAIQPTLCHTFKSPSSDSDSIHALTVSSCSRYLAVADNISNIHIYDLQKFTHKCSLPRGQSVPTAVAFHPTEALLAFVCSDRKIYEYDYEKCEYTSWSRQFSMKCPKEWSYAYATDKFKQIMYNPFSTNKIMLRDDERLYSIDKNQPFPAYDAKVFDFKNRHREGKEADKSGFHVSYRYKFLLHLSVLQNGQLVIVERPPGSISDELPPTLKLKKFGT